MKLARKERAAAGAVGGEAMVVTEAAAAVVEAATVVAEAAEADVAVMAATGR